MTELLVAFAVFLAMAAVGLACARYLMSPHVAVQHRIECYVDPPSDSFCSPGQAMAPGWLIVVRRLSRLCEWSGWARGVEHRLIQAGLPLRGTEFMVICLGCALGGIMLMLAISSNTMVALAGGFGGYLAPLAYLRGKISRRAKAFNSQLGDTLTLVSNSLRTGYSFLQAIEMVSREMPQPISIEFGRVLKEMNLGVTAEEALNNMAKRIDSDDLDLVITAVLIQRQVGGNLAEVLDGIAGTIRERIKLKGDIKTLTAQGRTSGLIIGGLPFVLGGLIYWMNPEYTGILFTHSAGQLMMLLAGMSQIVGVIWLRKIVDIRL